MSNAYVISGLTVKRAEVSGTIADLQERIRQERANLAHIDATLRLFDPDAKPEAIPSNTPFIGKIEPGGSKELTFMDPAHKWDTNHRRELLTSMNLEATLNAILGSEGSMTVLPSISVEYGNPRNYTL